MRPNATMTALLLMLLAPAAWGQTATLRASVDSARVGERFELTLTARHDGTMAAVLPDTGRAFGGDLALLERLRTGSAISRDGSRIDSAVYRVAAFALDTLVVPPVAVGLVHGADTLLVPSRPFKLPMIAAAPTGAAELQPAHRRMDFPLPIWVWLAAVAAVAALALGAYLIARHLRTRPGPPAAAAPRLSPADAARQRLRALEATDLHDPAQVKPYYIILTDALRRYIEATTGIPALEQTSGELLRQAQQAARAGLLPAEVPARLVTLFAVADYAKFADGHPAPEEGVRSRLDALGVVDQIEAHRTARAAEPQPAEVPDA